MAWRCELAAEDPSFRVSTDFESGQTRLKGMGELHLDIKVDILRRTYKVDANVGAPQVAYRETIRGRRHRLHAQEAVRRYGPVRPRQADLRTAAAGSGSSSNQIVGGAIPKEFIPGVEKGLKSVMNSGPLAGFPVIDFKVT